MQNAQRKTTISRAAAPAAVLTRHQQKHNVIEWREGTRKKSLQVEPAPSPLIPAKRENTYIGFALVIAFLLFAGRMAGLV